jgi:hypothetical protein
MTFCISLYILFFIHVHFSFYTRTFYFLYTYTLSKIIRCSRNNNRFTWINVISEKIIASHNANFYFSFFLFLIWSFLHNHEFEISYINAMYLSFEAFILTINNHVESQNYAVAKQRIKKNFKIDQMIKIYFCCDRKEKSKLKSHEQKQKHSFIRLIKCSFSCFALNKVDMSWILVMQDFSHNHSLIIEKTHFALRKLAIISETMNKSIIKARRKLLLLKFVSLCDLKMKTAF